MGSITMGYDPPYYRIPFRPFSEELIGQCLDDLRAKAGKVTTKFRTVECTVERAPEDVDAIFSVQMKGEGKDFLNAMERFCELAGLPRSTPTAYDSSVYEHFISGDWK